MGARIDFRFPICPNLPRSELCHRDYASVGTVQVRIFEDRLEVWNPGILPPDLSIEDLYRQHASYPRNPRLARALYRARLIEHWGTGTLRIIRACEGSNIKVDFSIQAGSFVVRLLKTPHLPVEGVGKEVGERVGVSSGLTNWLPGRHPLEYVHHSY